MKVLVCFMIICTGYALAQDKIQVGMELQLWNNTAGFSIEEFEGASDLLSDPFNGEYKDRELHPSLGISLQYRSFFLKATVSNETEYSGTDDEALIIWENNNTIIIDLYDGDMVTALDRQDYDISLGYTMDFGLAIFAGYKSIDLTESFSSTDLLWGRGTIPGTDEDIIVDGGPFSLVHEYTYDGPFLGLGYGYTISGYPVTLRASFAYSQLDGENKTFGDFRGESTQLLFDDELGLDADGLSWSAGISYEIKERFDIMLSFRAQDYNGENKDYFIPDLESNGFQLSIGYYF